MDRFSLTDAQWAKMAPFCLDKPTDPGRTGGDALLFTEAVDVASPDNALSPGLYGIVHLEQDRDAPVIAVPSEAVIFDQNGFSAAVIQNGRTVIHPLTVLEDDGAQIQVRAGLRPGDRVILNPPADLTPGMSVRTS